MPSLSGLKNSGFTILSLNSTPLSSYVSALKYFGSTPRWEAQPPLNLSNGIFIFESTRKPSPFSALPQSGSTPQLSISRLFLPSGVAPTQQPQRRWVDGVLKSGLNGLPRQFFSFATTSATLDAISPASLSTFSMLFPNLSAPSRNSRKSSQPTKSALSAGMSLSASRGLSLRSLSIAAKQSATTVVPWMRQPLPLYFVPCL